MLFLIAGCPRQHQRNGPDATRQEYREAPTARRVRKARKIRSRGQSNEAIRPEIRSRSNGSSLAAVSKHRDARRCSGRIPVAKTSRDNRSLNRGEQETVGCRLHHQGQRPWDQQLLNGLADGQRVPEGRGQRNTLNGKRRKQRKSLRTWRSPTSATWYTCYETASQAALRPEDGSTVLLSSRGPRQKAQQARAAPAPKLTRPWRVHGSQMPLMSLGSRREVQTILGVPGYSISHLNNTRLLSSVEIYGRRILSAMIFKKSINIATMSPPVAGAGSKRVVTPPERWRGLVLESKVQEGAAARWPVRCSTT